MLRHGDTSRTVSETSRRSRLCSLAPSQCLCGGLPLSRSHPARLPGRKDLLAMPWELTEEVLSILRISEEHGLWPQQLLTGLISSLEKVPGAAKVSHYRPICVLSLCYRTWSSLRCKEALRHVAQFAPPGLPGNLPGAGASDSWYSILLQIEGAYRAGTELFGVAVDLVKAYNMLPRLPVAAFARMCGIPDCILTPLSIHVDATSPPLQSAWQHGTPAPLLYRVRGGRPFELPGNGCPEHCLSP